MRVPITHTTAEHKAEMRRSPNHEHDCMRALSFRATPLGNSKIDISFFSVRGFWAQNRASADQPIIQFGEAGNHCSHTLMVYVIPLSGRGAVNQLHCGLLVTLEHLCSGHVQIKDESLHVHNLLSPCQGVSRGENAHDVIPMYRLAKKRLDCALARKLTAIAKRKMQSQMKYFVADFGSPEHAIIKVAIQHAGITIAAWRQATQKN